MKTRPLVAILAVLALTLSLAGIALAMSSNNYRLDWFVPLTGSGGSASSANYKFNYTVGQTVTGSSSGTNSKAGLGFWAGMVARPGVPVLLSPANGTKTASHTITLSWKAGPGDAPEGYNLKLDGSVITTNHTSYAATLPSGTHTWQVRAFNAGGTSSYSATWQFTVLHQLDLPIVKK